MSFRGEFVELFGVVTQEKKNEHFYNISHLSLSFSLSLSPYLSTYVLLCFFSMFFLFLFFLFLFFYSSRKARIFGYTNTGARLPQRTS